MILMIIATVIVNQVLVGAGIAAGIGAMLLLWGWKSRREAGAVAQIPAAPVSSISAGPVHVYGKATGDDRLVSPISGASCYYYKLQIEKRVKQGDQERWESFKSETGQRRFFLDDGSGRVMIDPQGAEFDIPQTLRAEMGPRSAHYCHVDPALGIGMLTENQLHAALISDWGQARAVVQNMGTSGVARAADAVLEAGEKMAQWGVSVNVGGVEINPGLMGESFRIQETCLLAGHEYSVIGTCNQNPNARDDHGGKVVHKGPGEKIFLISAKTGQQLVQRLRVQAAVMMTVGVVLILGAATWVLIRR